MLSREPILALESENKKLLFFGELRVLKADNFCTLAGTFVMAPYCENLKVFGEIGEVLLAEGFFYDEIICFGTVSRLISLLALVC